MHVGASIRIGTAWNAAFPEPKLIEQEELPVLEAFIGIRNRLTALKMVCCIRGDLDSRLTYQDTTRFIKSQDVMTIYNSVVKQGEFSTVPERQS
jgi:hypothetical protein